MRPSRPVSLDTDLEHWRRQFRDVTPIADLVPRREATVVGVVTRILVRPGSSLSLRLADGSGEIQAVWTGRQSLPGVTLGSALQLTAAVATQQDGTPLLRNPAWSPVSEPFSFPP